MAASQNKPKRNHHILPEFYLKGFVIKKNEPFLWIYKRGEDYNPGQGKITNNPYKESVGEIFERDFYAEPTKAKKEDFEVFEDKLEQLEKPCNQIFEKLRSRQRISAEEKHQFSIYIEMMRRRVLAGRETIKELLPKHAAEYEPSIKLFQNLNWPDTPETRGRLKQISERIVQEEGFDVRMHNRTSVAAPDSLLIEVLEKMTWSFYIAPESHAFFTTDNPVFISEKFGLQKNISELSFPISNDVALVASWNRNLKEGFVEAKPQVVKELNRRTASKASRQIYFSKNSDWVIKVLNKNFYEYRPIYSVRPVFTVAEIVTDGPESKPRVVVSI
jgi:hypothetical protein